MLIRRQAMHLQQKPVANVSDIFGEQMPTFVEP